MPVFLGAQPAHYLDRAVTTVCPCEGMDLNSRNHILFCDDSGLKVRLFSVRVLSAAGRGSRWRCPAAWC